MTKLPDPTNEEALAMIEDGPQLLMDHVALIGAVSSDAIVELFISFSHSISGVRLNFPISIETAESLGASLIKGAEAARLEQAQLDAAKATKN